MDDARPLDHAIPADSSGDIFSSAIAQAAEEKWRVLLTRDGKPIAAIVPLEDYDALEAAEDAEDQKRAAEALSQWRAAGCPRGIPLEQVARELGIDLDTL